MTPTNEPLFTARELWSLPKRGRFTVAESLMEMGELCVHLADKYDAMLADPAEAGHVAELARHTYRKTAADLHQLGPYLDADVDEAVGKVGEVRDAIREKFIR